ncbi:ATP synthase d subunit [Candidozyma auris]
MSVAKSAATKLNWANVISSLGLTGKTSASLTAFKKRNDEAKKQHLELTSEPLDIDFAHYRKVLKNQSVVDEVEKAVKAFKPVTYDVSKTLKTIDIFEQKAVENAKLTEKSVLEEIEQLQATLKRYETSNWARSCFLASSFLFLKAVKSAEVLPVNPKEEMTLAQFNLVAALLATDMVISKMDSR